MSGHPHGTSARNMLEVILLDTSTVTLLIAQRSKCQPCLWVDVLLWPRLACVTTHLLVSPPHPRDHVWRHNNNLLAAAHNLNAKHVLSHATSREKGHQLKAKLEKRSGRISRKPVKPFPFSGLSCCRLSGTPAVTLTCTEAK